MVLQIVSDDMHFICPECERPLTKERSWHYCKKITPDSLFEGKPIILTALFDKLIASVGTWEGVSFSATKSCIVFIKFKTFLVVKVMKTALDLKFTLPEESDDFPIYKRAAYGKKLEHYIRLAEVEELDNDVFRMLRKAYEMDTLKV